MEYRLFSYGADPAGAEIVLTDDDYLQWNEPDRWDPRNTVCVVKVSDLLKQERKRAVYKKNNTPPETILEDFMVVHWAWKKAQ